jgi:hypothetical protein
VVDGNTSSGERAWVAARFTPAGIVAHQSALQGGARLAIDDFSGDAPETLPA